MSTTDIDEAALRERARALLANHTDDEGVPDPNQCETCIDNVTVELRRNATEVAELRAEVERLRGEVKKVALRIAGVVEGLAQEIRSECEMGPT